MLWIKKNTNNLFCVTLTKFSSNVHQDPKLFSFLIFYIILIIIEIMSPLIKKKVCTEKFLLSEQKILWHKTIFQAFNFLFTRQNFLVEWQNVPEDIFAGKGI